MQKVKLSQIMLVRNVPECNLGKIASAINQLVETDFEIMEGAYYVYQAHAVASIFIEVNNEEIEYRLSYPVSNSCFIYDELDESQAQMEAAERLYMDISDCNDIILDVYI